MPNVTIYLPETLHARVKNSGLAMSKVCQEALWAAVGIGPIQTEEELSPVEVVTKELDRAATTLRKIAKQIEKEWE